jgi:hypothetical protein
VGKGNDKHWSFKQCDLAWISLQPAAGSQLLVNRWREAGRCAGNVNPAALDGGSMGDAR